jgi:RHS repeat-associated protein
VTPRNASSGAALADEGTERCCSNAGALARSQRLLRACVGEDASADARGSRYTSHSKRGVPMRMTLYALGGLLRQPAPPPKLPNARERAVRNRLRVLQAGVIGVRFQLTLQALPVHADHLNTPRAVMDLDNAMRWSWTDPSDAFGKEPAANDPLGLGAVTFNLRFPGQVYDSESGMHYNVNRDYVPGMGRYAQSDPIGLEGGINTYTYVAVNPLSYADPLGLAAGPVPYGASYASKGGVGSPKDKKDAEMCAKYQPTYQTCFACCLRNNPLGGNVCREQCSHRDPPYPDAPFLTKTPDPAMCMNDQWGKQ